MVAVSLMILTSVFSTRLQGYIEIILTITSYCLLILIYLPTRFGWAITCLQMHSVSIKAMTSHAHVHLINSRKQLSCYL